MGKEHDIVEMDFQSWSKIWGRLADRGGTPWRQEEAAEEDEATALPAITRKDLRKAGRTFKERTGTGTDKLGPRHYAWLSDQLFDVIAKLLMNIESTGTWPQQLCEALVHLIQKRLVHLP